MSSAAAPTAAAEDADAVAVIAIDDSAAVVAGLAAAKGVSVEEGSPTQYLRRPRWPLAVAAAVALTVRMAWRHLREEEAAALTVLMAPVAAGTAAEAVAGAVAAAVEEESVAAPSLP
jgi:hypothetical protein